MIAAPNALATPHQRLYIRTLLRELDLDTRRMTRSHARFFSAARLIAPAPGADLEAALCEMTRGQASALIAQLKSEAEAMR